jgi:hypothetical protein
MHIFISKLVLRAVGDTRILATVALLFVGEASGATQRVENYSFTPETTNFQNFFGRELATDGNTALVTSIEDVPGSLMQGRIYFLELRQGRWEIEHVTRDLPGGPFSPALIEATVEGDIAVVSGRAVGSGGASAGNIHHFLYTFRRTAAQGWALEATERVPRIHGFPLVAQLELRAGLLTFQNWDRVLTYERVANQWRRRPGTKINQLLSGATSPGLAHYLTRSDRELFAIPETGAPIANVYGWHRFDWELGRWRRTQIIGLPQPPNASQEFIPNGGTDAGSGWFMFGSHPRNGGVGVVIVLRKNATSGEYEYHSTIRPTNSVPGPVHGRDQFGSSLDLDHSTGRLVVGAPWSGGPGSGVAGRAFMFRYDPSTDEWVQSERYTYSERAQQAPSTFVDFGYRVALWDNGCMVSSRIAPSATGVQGVGKLYVYEDDFGTSYCNGTIVTPGQVALLGVGGSNVLPHAGWRIDVRGLPVSTPFSALISPTSASVLLPQGGGEMICVGGPRTYTGGIRLTEPDGSASLAVDLSEPSLNGVLAGDHRFVQIWFRMPAGSSQPVGLTNSIDVTFR